MQTFGTAALFHADRDGAAALAKHTPREDADAIAPRGSSTDISVVRTSRRRHSVARIN